jgi:AbrB family looped-hinge helix DNA binding protein
MPKPNSTLEYLTTTKIGEKGQLTVPKQFREELGLGAGSPFAVLRIGDGLLLLPEQLRFEHLCEKIRTTLMSAGATPDSVLETLPAARQRVFDRLYGAPQPKPATARRRPLAARAKAIVLKKRG